MPINDLYHEGEQEVQKRANESDTARINGGAVDETILAGALRFIEQQPMAVISSIDAQGQVWISTLFGDPGFIRALNTRTVEIDITQPRATEDDPLWINLKKNSNVGLLIIELGSRRRYRINGHVDDVNGERIIIDVDRAYPNCPKYIQRREWKKLETNERYKAIASTRGKGLTKTQQKLINSADTFFVGSAHPEHGVDASHRGGTPGFVNVINNQQLRIPDYSGNSMFNTLGNFTSYPYAGLVFIDFDRGRVLQVTGRPEILWDVDDLQGETGGTNRYWQLDITHWQESTIPYHFTWELQDYSPHIPKSKKTGTENKLSLIVKQIRQQNDRVKSFLLCAHDGSRLPEFQAGAHIRLKVKLPDGHQADRHYSILSDPNDRQHYEIGILKEAEGRGGSLYMHEEVNEGDNLEIDTPVNDFPLANKAKHSILITGGIGITPILSMMQKLASDKQSYEIHYSSRTFEGLVFRDRIEQIAGDKAHFYASREPEGKRLELEKLLSTPQPDVHIYFCGPRKMITAIRDKVETHGWPSAQIHFESFGAQALVDDHPISVQLARSNKMINVPADKSILDTLLEAGVEVPHDCKRGECTLCSTRVFAGEPEHRDLCLNTEEKASSMCLCVSRARGEKLKLDL